MAEADETGALPSLSSTSSQRILRSINELYATGLSGDAPGSAGLTKISEDPAIGIRIPSPRQKVRCGANRIPLPVAVRTQEGGREGGREG